MGASSSLLEEFFATFLDVLQEWVEQFHANVRAWDHVVDVLVVLARWGESGSEADINMDGIVDVNDVLAVIGFWGSPGPIGDIDFDGVVGVNDVLIVLGAWGNCS